MKYMGSKRRIAPYISQYINDIANCYNIKDYYEPFMGGCSVGELVQVKNRHLSDIDKHIVALFQRIQEGLWEFKYIDRDTWYKIKDDRIKNSVYPEWLTGWCGIACSFRGRYFEGFAGKYIDSITGKEINPQLQVYNSLKNEVALLQGIQFECRSYIELTNLKHTIIYCDAPYRGTTQYNKKEQFDFDAYDQWLVKLSKDNLVLISEYSMAGKHLKKFKQLDQWVLNKSIGSGQTECETSIERLFYVKNGWLTKELFETEIDIF